MQDNRILTGSLRAEKQPVNKVGINEQRVLAALRRIERLLGVILLDSDSRRTVQAAFREFANYTRNGNYKGNGFAYDHTPNGARFIEHVADELQYISEEDQEKYGYGVIEVLKAEDIYYDEVKELRSSNAMYENHPLHRRAESIAWVVNSFYQADQNFSDTISYYLKRKQLFSMLSDPAITKPGKGHVAGYLFLQKVHQAVIEDPELEKLPVEWQVELVLKQEAE